MYGVEMRKSYEKINQLNNLVQQNPYWKLIIVHTFKKLPPLLTYEMPRQPATDLRIDTVTPATSSHNVFKVSFNANPSSIHNFPSGFFFWNFPNKIL
jgi:hypothetical protein